MTQRETGQYHTSTFKSEQVNAFVPHPLPPSPPVEMSGRLSELQFSAAHMLGRLDGAVQNFPNKHLFLYQYIRAEAVMSSRIEGTQSTLVDLLEYEITDQPNLPDVVEVSNYVRAVEHGLRRLRDDGFPLSSRLIRETHAILLSGGQTETRGSDKLPGEFRRSQNWIGGSRPGTARFVPPPHTEVQGCMADLERFLHTRGDGLSPIIRAGLAHVQFETIHPFLDGNGRVGRLLITLMLCDAGVLSEPLLYLSLHLERHRGTYYDLLNEVRQTGDWEAWLEFFLDGVAQTAKNAVDTAAKMTRLFETDEAVVGHQGRRTSSSLQVLRAFQGRPILTKTKAKELAGLSYSAVANAVELLEELGIVKETTGKSRNRLYVYDKYLELLRKATND